MKFPTVFATTFVLAAAGSTSTATAQTTTAQMACPPEINIIIGKTESLMKLSDKRTATIMVNDPDIADVRTNPVEGSGVVVVLVGKKPGRTNFRVYDQENLVCSATIKVGKAMRFIRNGAVETFVCDSEWCQPPTSKEPALSDLPAGSSVTMPVGRRQ